MLHREGKHTCIFCAEGIGICLDVSLFVFLMPCSNDDGIITLSQNNYDSMSILPVSVVKK